MKFLVALFCSLMVSFGVFAQAKVAKTTPPKPVAAKPKTAAPVKPKAKAKAKKLMLAISGVNNATRACKPGV